MMNLYAALLAKALGGSGGGGGSDVLNIGTNPDTGGLLKTWQEIYNAYSNGTICLVPFNDSLELVMSMVSQENRYMVMTLNGTWIASNAADYPSPD